MELVKEFFWGIKPASITKKKWNARRAVRAMVKHGDKIAVIKSAKYGFYKCLPGGGIDDNEDIKTALKREIREEVGCNINIIGEIGAALEYIEDHSLISLSFVFVAEVVGKLGEPQFTDKEKEDGFTLEWHTIQDVFALINNAKSTNKRGGEQMEREKILLEYYLKNAK